MSDLVNWIGWLACISGGVGVSGLLILWAMDKVWNLFSTSMAVVDYLINREDFNEWKASRTEQPR